MRPALLARLVNEAVSYLDFHVPEPFMSLWTAGLAFKELARTGTERDKLEGKLINYKTEGLHTYIDPEIDGGMLVFRIYTTV